MLIFFFFVKRKRKRKKRKKKKEKEVHGRCDNKNVRLENKSKRGFFCSTDPG
jgi:hypothetical protein